MLLIVSCPKFVTDTYLCITAINMNRRIPNGFIFPGKHV